MRANTSSKKAFTLDRPGGNTVTFQLPDPTAPSYIPGSAFCTTITLPEGTIWTPFPHWHEHYTEKLRVLKGKARVILNGVARVVGPEDGEVIVEPMVVHEFMRADIDGGVTVEGDVVIQEYTEPSDGFKEVFFRSIFSVLDNAKNEGRPMSYQDMLQVVLTMDHCDNWNVLLPGPLSYYATHVAYFVGSSIARLFGMRAWYTEWLPQRLHAVAENGGQRYISKTKTS